MLRLILVFLALYCGSAATALARNRLYQSCRSRGRARARRRYITRMRANRIEEAVHLLWLQSARPSYASAPLTPPAEKRSNPAGGRR